MTKLEIKKILFETFNGNVIVTEFQKGENSHYCVLNANTLKDVISLKELESSIFDCFSCKLPDYNKISVQVFGFDDVRVVFFL